jgi:hypothetical protein
MGVLRGGLADRARPRPTRLHSDRLPGLGSHSSVHECDAYAISPMSLTHSPIFFGVVNVEILKTKRRRDRFRAVNQGDCYVEGSKRQ